LLKIMVMNAIVISIDPVIARLGPLMLRWYSLFFVLAILVGLWPGLREARRKGLDVEQVKRLTIWAVIGGLIGARLFHVIDRWDLYAAQPVQALYVWQGGLAVYGGLIGGTLTGIVYARRHGLPVWKLADALTPGIILGLAVGRLACIPNGDAIGAPANVPWAFVYTNPMSMVPPQLLGVPVHPYPVYEMLFDLATLGLFWPLRHVFKTDGMLFLSYASIYAIGRFWLTFYRIERVWFWELQEAQVIALVVLVIALVLIVWRSVWRRHAPDAQLAREPGASQTPRVKSGNA